MVVCCLMHDTLIAIWEWVCLNVSASGCRLCCSTFLCKMCSTFLYKWVSYFKNFTTCLQKCFSLFKCLEHLIQWAYAQKNDSIIIIVIVMVIIFKIKVEEIFSTVRQVFSQRVSGYKMLLKNRNTSETINLRLSSWILEIHIK